jgi:hypothetical protein
MGYVHEGCLKRWLFAKNTRVCELCQTPFSLQEQLLSLREILSKAKGYFLSDTTRILKTCLYLVYMYLFTKRAFQLSSYFFKLLVGTIT